MFDPHYEPPSRNYMSRVAIPGLYNSTKDKVLKGIHRAEFFFIYYRFMVQHNTSEPYMGITLMTPGKFKVNAFKPFTSLNHIQVKTCLRAYVKHLNHGDLRNLNKCASPLIMGPIYFLQLAS